MTDPATPILAAAEPWHLGWSEWKAVFARVWVERSDDDLSTRAAAVAFSAMFSIPTLLIAVVSVYGLVASPSQVTDLVERADTVLPRAATELLTTQLERLTSASSGGLSLGLFLGLLGAVWSVSGGVNRLLETINEVYDEEDSRPWYTKRAWSIAASLAVIVVIVMAVGLIALLPPVVKWLGVSGALRMVLLFGRWLMLATLMVGLLELFYRVGPKRPTPELPWITVGTVAAVIAWVLMSIGFSVYVQNLASYDATYGSLGTVIVFMLWLYLSSYIVLLAGELNSELENENPAGAAGNEEGPRSNVR